jgi:hypothetical protein
MFFALQIIILFCLCACQDKTPPSAYAMRAHIVGKLTEQQIRDLHTEAEKEFERALAEAKRNESEFWDKRAKKFAEYASQCKDVGFKTKNPDKCDTSLPIFWQSIGQLPPGHDSVEAIFESKLMGMCNFAHTISDARRLGCLP